jgi:hypothetical protein
MVLSEGRSELLSLVHVEDLAPVLTPSCITDFPSPGSFPEAAVFSQLLPLKEFSTFYYFLIHRASHYCR